MHKKDRVQIPITTEKKELLEAKSLQLGFDSITDTVRYLINCFLSGKINISINTEQIETLSKEGEIEILESLLEKAKGKTIKVDPHDKNFHKQVLKFADE